MIFVGFLLGLKAYARFYPTLFLHHKEKVLAGALYTAFFIEGALLSATPRARRTRQAMTTAPGISDMSARNTLTT